MKLWKRITYFYPPPPGIGSPDWMQKNNFNRQSKNTLFLINLIATDERPSVQSSIRKVISTHFEVTLHRMWKQTPIWQLQRLWQLSRTTSSPNSYKAQQIEKQQKIAMKQALETIANWKETKHNLGIFLLVFLKWF